MFSNRLPPHAEINPLSRALAALRAAGAASDLDLTESNPTAVGFSYPGDLFDALSAEHVGRYAPQPLGLGSAREAVAADYARRGAEVDPRQVVLSASSSEAYSWLFKLLCDPGDSVLVPQPSYPLFEHLTRLEAVQAIPYHLEYHGRWEIDFESVSAAPANVRALLLVSPNNPTGSFVKPGRGTAAGRDLPGRADGRSSPTKSSRTTHSTRSIRSTEVAIDLDVLSFTLGGASKSLGLPQIKLGWIVVGGPQAERARALAALEIIADTFLSVGHPGSGWQHPRCLLAATSSGIRFAAALAGNLACARHLAHEHPSCTLLPVEGGWSVVVRVPAFRSEEALALDVARARTRIGPSRVFFRLSARSLHRRQPHTRPDQFRDAFARTLRFACSPGSSVSEHKG